MSNFGGEVIGGIFSPIQLEKIWAKWEITKTSWWFFAHLKNMHKSNWMKPFPKDPGENSKNVWNGCLDNEMLEKTCWNHHSRLIWDDQHWEPKDLTSKNSYRKPHRQTTIDSKHSRNKNENKNMKLWTFDHGSSKKISKVLSSLFPNFPFPFGHLKGQMVRPWPWGGNKWFWNPWKGSGFQFFPGGSLHCSKISGIFTPSWGNGSSIFFRVFPRFGFFVSPGIPGNPYSWEIQMSKIRECFWCYFWKKI